MHFSNSIFGKLLKPINRRQFKAIVERHDGDAYDKSFKSWDHLIALIYAQFTCASEPAWPGGRLERQQPASLSSGQRSAGGARPCRMPTAAARGGLCRDLQPGRRPTRPAERREGKEMLRLIDSTPIPLGKLCDWAKSNGRIRGMKMHVVYDPQGRLPAHPRHHRCQRQRRPDRPHDRHRDRRHLCLRQGLLPLWLVDAPSRAPSRSSSPGPKTNMGLKLVQKATGSRKTKGDGFTVLEDAEVSFASKGDSKLPMPAAPDPRQAPRTAAPSLS